MSDFAAGMILLAGFWILFVMILEIIGLIISGLSDKESKDGQKQSR